MSILMKNANRPLSAGSLKRPFLALALILMSVTSVAAAGLGIDLTTIPKLTAYHMVPDGDFKKSTRVETEKSPFGDDYLSYEIRLPKDWVSNSQDDKTLSFGKKALDDDVPDILARYISAPKNLMRSNLVIEAQALSYEVSVQNWFVNFILKNGFSLTAMETKSDREIEALYVQVDKDTTYVVRIRVVVNGPRLILIRHYLPQENFEEEKGQQRQIVASFKLLNPTQERIEKQLEYGFLDQSYFNYPNSWTLNAKPIYSIERMSATIFRESEVLSKEEQRRGRRQGPAPLDGQIKVNVVSKLLKTSLAQEVQTFRNAIDIKNYTLGKPIERITYKYDPSIKSGQAQVYSLVPSNPVTMGHYEIVISVMENNDFYYITSLVTPSRDQDFYIWARNIESVRIVNESLRRSNFRYNPNDPYYEYLKE